MSDVPLHLIAELSVRDPVKLLEYARRVQPLMERFGGRIVATSARGSETLEGDGEAGLMVLHHWPSRAAFDRFWESAEYAPVRELRREACGSRIVIFESDSPDFSDPDPPDPATSARP